MPDGEQRRYQRHPIRVPVAVRSKGSAEFLSRVGDLSEGGVSFASVNVLPVGASIEIELDVHHTRFTLTGTVVSCLELPGVEGFRIGLSFESPAMAFKLKLAEQVLRIEELQRELTLERGTAVTRAEAAEVWVRRYAAAFARFYKAR